MLDAAVKALSQILSPPMRSILWRSIGLALVLITALAIGLQRLLSWFAEYGEAWGDTVLGPGSNPEHWNHFHFDLRERHGARRYCD